MTNEGPIPNLFRSEYRKIVAVLTRRFGFEEIATAEDIASETFLTAAHAWGLQGMPENPVAWLYQVARNKALNYLNRQRIFENTVATELRQSATVDHSYDLDLSAANIFDSQLEMMFAICHPAIAQEAQVGLALRLLCGFGIEEIADAFLTSKETINKRLFRAKETLREKNIRLEMPAGEQIDVRLAAVLRTIYLLFNEGYCSRSHSTTLRKDFCLEAMRLCTMLLENTATNKPDVNALLALMCFHTSRFDARMTVDGELNLYAEQDTQAWNQDLISKGGYFLQRAATGDYLSKYHLEAGIAYWHTCREDTPEKWESILDLYNRLLQVEYSAVAALNRTFALSKARGKKVAIPEAEALALTDDQWYYALLGELYTGIDDQKARRFFCRALEIAKTGNQKRSIKKRMDSLP